MGFATLSFGDAVVKTMTGLWPPTAIAALRYVLGASGLIVLLWAREGRGAFRVPKWPLHLARGAGVAMATVGFFSAVFVMPLAVATAITFTSPMFTALLAAALLGEPARRVTWLATLFAFAGVLVVLRPNVAALGFAAGLPLLSALGMSVLMVANRASAGSASPLALQVFVAGTAAPLLVLVTMAGNASGLPRLAVHWPQWSVVARCALVAVTASFAHFAIYKGTVRAGAATIAPMTYVQLLVATALGWLMFGNTPDAVTLVGAAMIVAAGLVLWRAGRVVEVSGTD